MIRTKHFRKVRVRNASRKGKVHFPVCCIFSFFALIALLLPPPPAFSDGGPPSPTVRQGADSPQPSPTPSPTPVPDTGPKAVIVAPDKCTAGSLVFVQTTGSAGKEYKWEISPKAAAACAVQILTMDGRPALVFASADVTGPISFFLAVASGDHCATAMHVLENGVGPNPIPPPPPPQPQKLEVVVVEETLDLPSLPPGQLALLSSLSFRQALQAKGHRLFRIDKDGRDPRGAAPAEYAPFLKAAEGKKLPQMVIRYQDTTTIKAFDLPKDEASAWELLKANGG